MNGPALPLEGVRVLDAASFVAGPLAAMLLGDFGADVIKAESLAGDPARYLGGTVADDLSATFAAVNRGKRSVALELSESAGRRSLAALAASADVVIHNQRPAVAARLGLDPLALAQHDPPPVLVEITAFGREGPYADRPALDPIVQAMSGIVAMSGSSEGEPTRAAAPVVDVATALTAAFGALAGLRARDRSPEPQVLTVSLFEVGVLLNAPAFAIQSLRDQPLARLGNASHALLADQFAAADGLVWLAVWEDRQWRALCELLGLGELSTDARFESNEGRVGNQELARPRLSDAIKGWEAEALRAALDEAGIPAAVTMSLEDVMADPHVKQTGALRTETRLPGADLTLVAGPLRLGGNRPVASRPAPRLGAHTEEVLAELR